MPQISLDQLIQKAKQFTKKQYNVELDIPIRINNRLKITLGRYRETNFGQPMQIDIAGKLLTYAHKNVAIDVVKHEAVHFALSKLNKPYHDGDDYFENELIRLNLPSSTRKDRSLLFVGQKYIFHCKQCKNQLITTIKRVKVSTKHYMSSCCNSPLQYVETIICDGTKQVNHK